MVNINSEPLRRFICPSLSFCSLKGKHVIPKLEIFLHFISSFNSERSFLRLIFCIIKCHKYITMVLQLISRLDESTHLTLHEKKTRTSNALNLNTKSSKHYRHTMHINLFTLTPWSTVLEKLIILSHFITLTLKGQCSDKFKSTTNIFSLDHNIQYHTLANIANNKFPFIS